MDIVTSLWVEKYRPKVLSELVLPDNYRQDFQVCIQRREISNFLFYGPPGSGKTCISLILCSKNGILERPEDNLLQLNGSAKETRGIGMIDNLIEPFLKIPPSGNDIQKIVFIDEADYLTDAAAHALRGVIEKFNAFYGRFIFTCNYVSKVPEAIYSRTQPYEFKQMPMDHVYDHCKGILEKEKITYKDEDLKYVCENLYPDIRRIINCLQKNSYSGNLTVSRDTVLTNEKIILSSVCEVINYGKNKEFSKINSCLSTIMSTLNKQNDMDYRSIYEQLFFKKEVPASCKIVINKYSNAHGDCLVPQMHFMAMIFELIKSLQDYVKMSGAKNV